MKINRFLRSRARTAQFESLEPRTLLTVGNNLAVGDELRTYRLAVSATAEFTEQAGGQAEAYEAIKTLVEKVNDFYEVEAALHFHLVSGTNLVFTNTQTDGFSNSTAIGSTDLSTLGQQNKTQTDRFLGAANYDVGIVLGHEGNGNANYSNGRGLSYVGTVGNSRYKARAAAVGSNPNHAIFVDIVIHELGHQFSMEHTYSGSRGACRSSGWHSEVAVEPGAGSTMMSYSGSCGDDNLPADGAKRLHSVNFEQLESFVRKTKPFSTKSLGNSIPTVDAGRDYVIPTSTPFSLTASGQDADGDRLTYSWEQIDPSSSQRSLPVRDVGNGPLFRVFSPRSDSTRIFPDLQDLLQNNTTASKGEALPTTTRMMNFRVTVRDGKGGINSDDVLIRSHTTETPFELTHPNTRTSWNGGTTQEIRWNAAGTSDHPFNASQVNILLSIDGGATFSHTLASHVPNDGRHTVTVPNFDVAKARLKIEPVRNVFFDISDHDFSIVASRLAPGIKISPVEGAVRAFEGGDFESYDISLNTEPHGMVQIAIQADSNSLLSLDGVSFASSQNVAFDSTQPQRIYTRAVDDLEEEGPHQSIVRHEIVSSSSQSYSTALKVNDLIVEVVDNELPPVLGVDLDYLGPSPTHWSHVSWWNQPASGQFEDDGTQTNVELAFSDFGGGSRISDVAFDSTWLPRHGQSLHGLSGYVTSTTAVKGRWTGLDPGSEYGVLVFGYERRGEHFIQDVSIRGAATLPTFTQMLGQNSLAINDETGSNARTLSSYEHVVVADANGSVSLQISPASGSAGIALAGVAIRKIQPREFSLPAGPRVINVKVASSNWSDEFLDFVDDGFAGGPNAEKGFSLWPHTDPTPLPWLNLDRLVITFSEPVQGVGGRPLNAADFDVQSSSDDVPPFVQHVTLSGDKTRIVLHIAGGLPTSRYMVTVKSDSVENVSGVALDGELQLAAPSGDGQPGGNFELPFAVLIGGYARNDSAVNVADVTTFSASYQSTLGHDENYSKFVDGNGDGIINVFDLLLLSSVFLDSLTNDFPTAARTVSVTDAAVDEYFADDNGLVDLDSTPRLWRKHRILVMKSREMQLN